MRLLRRHREDPTPASPPPRDLYTEFLTGWDQLEIHGQDIHSTTDGVIYATEALLRWRRSPGELWAATMALPIAEETGLIGQCAQWALELSVTTWANSANRTYGRRLALDLHRTQLASPEIATDITKICDEAGVVPSVTPSAGGCTGSRGVTVPVTHSSTLSIQVSTSPR